MASYDKILGKSYEQLLPIYRKLAKRADQRLVRLEKYGETRPSVMNWAYKKAAYETTLYGSSKEKPRFNIKPPESEKQLRRKIAAMQNFLEMKSSTKKGIKEIDKKRLDSLNEAFGEMDPAFGDIPLDLWIELHESGAFKRLDDKYGFYTTMEAIGTIQRNKDQIKDLMQKAKKENITLKEKIKKDGRFSVALRDTINAVLTDEGVDIDKLL